MFCTNCGNQINDEASFCSNCGSPVVASANQQGTVQPTRSFSQSTQQPISDKPNNPNVFSESPTVGEPCPKCGSTNTTVLSEKQTGRYWWVWLIVAVAAFLITYFALGGVSQKAAAGAARIMIFAVILAVVGILQRLTQKTKIHARCSQCGNEFDYSKNK